MTPSQTASVAAEVREALLGARVAEVVGTDTEALGIRLRTQGEDRRLLISCHPQMARVHLASVDPEVSRHTPFSDLCAARLDGLRVAAVEHPAGERIVRLWFGGEGTDQQPASWLCQAGPAMGACLVAELFGRRPNLVLLDAAGVILGAWRTFPKGDRPIAPGVRYVALPPPEPTSDDAPPRTSAEWEAEFAPRERELLLAALRKRASEILEKERYRVDGVLRGLEAGLAASARCEELRMAGEVLKANLGRVPKGAERVELPDFTGGTVEVELDKRMDARSNLERIFRKYRRLREAKARIETRIGAFRIRRDEVAQSLARVASCDAPPELSRMAGDDRSGHARKADRIRKDRRPAGVRVFTSADGIGIWVGKGDAENDHLTFRLARGNDLWLHAKDVPGSHVVARIGKREPTQETLLDAAHLAVYYSKARGSGGAEVTYTRVKFVRKPRGARSGQVSLGDARTIFVRWEEARMARLAAGTLAGPACWSESGGSDEGA